MWEPFIQARLSMSSSDILAQLEHNMQKIQRCKHEIFAADLRGKYKKAFQALLDDTKDWANLAVVAATTFGINYKSIRRAEAESAMSAMITGPEYQQSIQLGKDAMRRNDYPGFVSALCAMRELSYAAMLHTGAGGSEQKEERAFWQTMISERTKQSTN